MPDIFGMRHHGYPDDPFYRTIRDDQGTLAALGTLELGSRVMWHIRNMRCTCGRHS